MTQIVERSLLRFIENVPELLDEEIDRVPPVQRDRDELEIATYRYRLRVWSGDMGSEILDRIFRIAPSHAREMRELRESRCQGFCRHLMFDRDAPDRVQDLVLNMVLASLGSQKRGGSRSRSIGVISDTRSLVVTDAFVGVCCSSLKKICGILKRKILNDGESVPRVRRNTTYDARVEPLYWLYPHNAVACQHITRRYWNPPAKVV